MADSILPHGASAPTAQTGDPVADARAPRTLDAREYINFLQLLESGWRMPPDTRAYLVTVHPAGAREVQAVPGNCSVLNLDNNLPKHLREAMLSTDALKAVREICTERLQGRSDAPNLMELDGDHGERATMAWRAACEIQQAAQVVRDLIDHTPEPAECNRVVDTLLRRMRDLAGLVASCLDGDDTRQGLQERLQWEDA